MFDQICLIQDIDNLRQGGSDGYINQHRWTFLINGTISVIQHQGRKCDNENSNARKKYIEYFFIWFLHFLSYQEVRLKRMILKKIDNWNGILSWE